MQAHFIAWKYFKSGGRFVSVSQWIAIVCLAVSIACLFVAMAVVSGFEKSIRQSVIDLSGHIMVFKQGGRQANAKEFVAKLKKEFPFVQSVTGFVHIEAVMANSEKVKAVVLQGIDIKTYRKVLEIDSRVVKGNLDFTENEKLNSVAVGTALAKEFNLKIGDSVQLVIPQSTYLEESAFSPKLQEFKVSAIVDLGKYEYNDKTLISSSFMAQKFADMPEHTFSGFRMKIKDFSKSGEQSAMIQDHLGPSYGVGDWYKVNRIFFQAVDIEKRILFIVLFIMVIAASFNVSSSLYVNVSKRYSDIAILKTLGASTQLIQKIFYFLSLYIAVAGCVLGLILGLLLCLLVGSLPLFDIPESVYMLSHLPIDIRLSDTLMIIIPSILICWIASLVPAKRGAKLLPVEALGHE